MTCLWRCAGYLKVDSNGDGLVNILDLSLLAGSRLRIEWFFVIGLIGRGWICWYNHCQSAFVAHLGDYVEQWAA